MTNVTLFLSQFMMMSLIWSGVIFGLRHILSSTHGDDLCEKAYLTGMVLVLPASVFAPVIQSLVPTTPLPLPDWPHAGALMGGMSPETPPVTTDIDWLTLLTSAISVIYLTGAVLFTARLVQGLIQLFRIETTAMPNADQRFWSTSEPISAIASLSGRVILSDHLASKLTPTQTGFILAHETAHLKRNDPLYFLFLSLLDTAFWFNPFFRTQTERCRHAAELDCDFRVIGKESHMRSAYAGSLLEALKHTAGNARPCVPAAFSRQRKGDYRMRMERILRPKPSLGKTTRFAVIGALGCLVLPMAASQMSFAAPTADFVMSYLPVEGKITSTFGLRPDPFTKKERRHNGLDIAAPKGTKIVTPCAGTVTRAENTKGYGNLIEIDHGKGIVTRYGQLDSFTVKAGDKVTKGMKIGEVGMSGRATGPHLHFEVIKDGENQDPESYLKK